MSEKTEQPTSKKIRDARNKGQVANSKEVVSSLSILALLVLVNSQGDAWGQSIKALMLMPAKHYGQPFGDAVKSILQACVELSVLILLPLCAVTISAAVIGTCSQIGLMFNTESLTPSLDRLNPGAAIKRMFNAQNLFEFLKSIIKIFFLSFLIVEVIREGLGSAIMAPACGFDCVIRILDTQLYEIVLYSAEAFVVAAALDFFFQRWNHIRQLKMSKDEVKREYKEMEGDPMIKGQRKQLHQQMLNEDTVERTKKATVLVTNPSHIAVALFYDKDQTALPTVLAKGENMLAQRMIAVARSHDIPIMQNVPLARALHSDAHLDQYVPSDLIEPVAEVLRWVQQLGRDGTCGL